MALDDISVRENLTGNQPTTQNDVASICNASGSATVNVLANDNGGLGTINPASLTISTAPPFSAGTVAVNGSDITFTPAAGFTGTTSFTYQVCNTNGCCSTASVVVSNVSLTANATATATTCGQANGTATATSNQATATFAWAGPNSYTATGTNITALAAGTYTVTATYAGCTATATVSVGNSVALNGVASP